MAVSPPRHAGSTGQPVELQRRGDTILLFYPQSNAALPLTSFLRNREWIAPSIIVECIPEFTGSAMAVVDEIPGAESRPEPRGASASVAPLALSAADEPSSATGPRLRRLRPIPSQIPESQSPAPVLETEAGATERMSADDDGQPFLGPESVPPPAGDDAIDVADTLPQQEQPAEPPAGSGPAPRQQPDNSIGVFCLICQDYGITCMLEGCDPLKCLI